MPVCYSRRRFSAEALSALRTEVSRQGGLIDRGGEKLK
jgi:hypothetical protein